jgi:hypothetical protein
MAVTVNSEDDLAALRTHLGPYIEYLEADLRVFSTIRGILQDDNFCRDCEYPYPTSAKTENAGTGGAATLYNTSSYGATSSVASW